MTQDVVISLIQKGIMSIILVSAPPLVIGLVVGVIASIFQTVTSIQEPTLAFIPKILGVFVALIIFGPYMLANLQEIMTSTYNSIPQLIIPK